MQLWDFWIVWTGMKLTGLDLNNFIYITDLSMQYVGQLRQYVEKFQNFIEQFKHACLLTLLIGQMS